MLVSPCFTVITNLSAESQGSTVQTGVLPTFLMSFLMSCIQSCGLAPHWITAGSFSVVLRRIHRCVASLRLHFTRATWLPGARPFGFATPKHLSRSLAYLIWPFICEGLLGGQSEQLL